MALRDERVTGTPTSLPSVGGKQFLEVNGEIWAADMDGNLLHSLEQTPAERPPENPPIYTDRSHESTPMPTPVGPGPEMGGLRATRVPDAPVLGRGAGVSPPPAPAPPQDPAPQDAPSTPDMSPAQMVEPDVMGPEVPEDYDWHLSAGEKGTQIEMDWIEKRLGELGHPDPASGKHAVYMVRSGMIRPDRRGASIQYWVDALDNPEAFAPPPNVGDTGLPQ